MQERVIALASAIVAGMIVMVLHELPKAIVYQLRTKKLGTYDKTGSIWRIYHYIDPIGLIFCATTYSGFSKPYRYQKRDSKTNIIIGITGLISLTLTFLCGLFLFMILFSNKENIVYNNADSLNFIVYVFLQNVCMISCGMFFVNLFPLAYFDMGHFIAAKSPRVFLSILRNDNIIKMILLFSMILGIFTWLSNIIIVAILALF